MEDLDGGALEGVAVDGADHVAGDAVGTGSGWGLRVRMGGHQRLRKDCGEEQETVLGT